MTLHSCLRLYCKQSRVLVSTKWVSAVLKHPVDLPYGPLWTLWTLWTPPLYGPPMDPLWTPYGTPIDPLWTLWAWNPMDSLWSWKKKTGIIRSHHWIEFYWMENANERNTRLLKNETQIKCEANEDLTYTTQTDKPTGSVRRPPVTSLTPVTPSLSRKIIFFSNVVFLRHISLKQRA